MEFMSPPADSRRHDLDALRAVAMLLGIFLHASLAYVPGIPWPVQDTQPAPWLGLLFLAIHGFRMPLFFLVSGFFTAMLWQRRGPWAMLAQRYKRVFVPLLLGFCTLLPFFDWVSKHAPGAAAAGAPTVPAGPASPLTKVIRAKDAAGVAAAIAAGADATGVDAEFRIPLITLAALVGNVDVTRALIDAGANPNALGGDGRTPLHAAAFAGHLPIVELLLEADADPAKRGPDGGSPLDSTKADAGTTAFIAGLLRIELASPNTLASDRDAIRALLASRTGESTAMPVLPPADFLTRARNAYRDWLLSPKFVVAMPLDPSPQSLLTGMTLNYLWFLMFLCWLAVGFAAVAALATRLGIPAPPSWLVTSPAALLWTVPLTLVPQVFMGLFAPGFGPDTSAGLLPQPHVLAYYAVFFGYGALLFLAEHRSNNADESVGRRWLVPLLISLLICFPVGLATIQFPAAGALPQVLYAWLMSFAAIGFFRWLVPAESRMWRYLSDSAYWLYLAHMPVVILLQQYSRGWPLSGTLKFFLVTTLATAILLVSYQLLVRHTPLGLLLNGPRPRHGRASRAAIRSVS
jgi:peptidoglycan/LPS O-acetylase OafA/YrhL